MSGGNANITISHPGSADWQMLWGNGSFDNVQLDIVGFLAVLGEGSVTANYQVSALSRLFYLPRLIPAPQALLPARRPTELPSKTAWVTGVYSGNVKEHIHHVASILLENDMKPFAVRCVEVRKKQDLKRATRLDTWMRGLSAASLQRSTTQSPNLGPPPVKATATGPLSWVTLLGFLLSFVLFLSSILWGDGMSLVATLLLSFLSTVIGAANKWTLKLPQRKPGSSPTRGDTVIRYPNGSFLVVKCEEDVARELYFAPEEIEYNVKNPTIYRMLSLVGTIMLMLGVVALANAKLQLQVAWAGAYIIINAAHWMAAAVPPKLHWDLSCYEVQEQCIEGGFNNPTFTDALWKAILVTKSTRWTRTGKAAPQTEMWDQWLQEAEEMANSVGETIGHLQQPLWPGIDPSKGTIYLQPKEWHAKDAWDEILRQHTRTPFTNNPMKPPAPPQQPHLPPAAGQTA